jgi:hypothetical protein
MWAKEEAMKPIRIPQLALEQLTELEELYRTTRDARLRTRAQMVLLAAERRLTAAEIAEIVRASERASEETVRRSISSATWPRGSRACAMCRIRAPRAK